MASLKPGGNFESSNQASRSLLRVHIFHRRLRQHQCALAKGVIYFQKNWVNLSKMEDDWFSTSTVERLQILFVSLRICRRCKIPIVHWPLADIADLSNKAWWQLGHITSQLAWDLTCARSQGGGSSYPRRSIWHCEICLWTGFTCGQRAIWHRFRDISSTQCLWTSPGLDTKGLEMRLAEGWRHELWRK